MTVTPNARESLEAFEARVKRIIAALEGSEREAFEAGLAAAQKPDTENCAPRHFATRERTTAWERGHAEGGKVFRA